MAAIRIWNSQPPGRPSYHMNFKNGSYAFTAADIKILRNYFGGGYQYGLFSNAAGILWGQYGNERVGNVDFYTGTPVINTA